MSIRVTAKLDDKNFVESINALAKQYENPNNVRHTVVTNILKEGGKIIEREAKANAPVSTTGKRPGSLRRSIRTVAKKRRRYSTPGAVVNHRTKNNPNVTFQKVLAVNYGLTGSRGYRPARPGNPYLSDAVDRKRSAVRERVLIGFRQDIDKFIRKRPPPRR